MFVFSVKPGGVRWILMAVIAGIAILILAMLSNGEGKATSTAAVVHGAEESQRRTYLTELGYELSPQPGQVQEVLLPVEFDEVFAAYNAMQQAEGMDLSPYRGERVKCWSYGITNYPGEASVLAHLYVYKDRIIGGDVSATAQGGFSHGLRGLSLQDAAT